MVSIKEGVDNAAAFARVTLGEERTKDLQLEEVETATTPEGDVWLITLSIVNNALASAFGRKGGREYKRFTVLKDSGEVTSMRIRELADA
jgi:hypothetical protein